MLIDVACLMRKLAWFWWLVLASFAVVICFATWLLFVVWFCVVSFNSVGIVLFFVFMGPSDAACLVG